MASVWIKWFDELSSKDINLVGGKNASLGEMISGLQDKGIKVPHGFAITAGAYRYFLEANGLDAKLREEIKALRQGRRDLASTGRYIRHRIRGAEFPTDLENSIIQAYQRLCEQYHEDEVSVAVRSSATAEDLPQASFAGQQDTFLNVSGVEELLEACQKCFASLFTDRAISYRENQGFEHLQIALSIGVQKMVRSDLAGAGVMFTIDTESGFDQVVFITAAYGLGETVVQGQVNPDEYYVYKPLLQQEKYYPILRKTLGSKEKKMIYVSGENIKTRLVDTRKDEQQRFVLNDDEIIKLAHWAGIIENHYSLRYGKSTPMDIEWAKDGETGDLYVVQARPETIHSQRRPNLLRSYVLKESGKVLAQGKSVGDAVAVSRACRLKSPDEIEIFQEGCIIVTEMTDPDWVPVMKKAVGIVTDRGGRTCHAAVVSRELGIPAVVGTDNATEKIANGQDITLSCAEGEAGKVYDGKLKYDIIEITADQIPSTKTKVMMNMASPANAFRWCQIPNDGVGLARIEFVINNVIQAHPLALIHYEQLKDPETKKKIDILTSGYTKRQDFFVDQLASAIAMIAAAFYPKDVIVRMSDFKSNEYAGLIGGKQFEPVEDNPMLGFRGASRYYSKEYREGFDLECQAIKQVRDKMGLVNVKPMIPFCRTLEEGEKVLSIMNENGLTQGKDSLEVYVMCEIPANVILAKEFAQIFDGFSIGSNDLTQLVLGCDRDSGKIAHIFDERNEAVKKMISNLIQKVKPLGRKVGICGQAPSDFPDFAAFLVKEGIDSISVNPDSILKVRKKIHEVETGMKS
jgi:pyruvate,water dikinase